MFALQGAAADMLSAAAEAVGPTAVAALLYRKAAAHKNPKVRWAHVGGQGSALRIIWQAERQPMQRQAEHAKAV
jgi:hypothetical protein